MKEYIAYQGTSYTVEWYFDDCGKSQALSYYKNLSVADRIKVLRLFKRMGDVGEIRDKTKFNYEGDQLFAFKPQPERFLCFFFEGKKIIVTNAFHKKQQKLPSNEKNRALQAKQAYICRIRENNYYEEN